MSTDRSETAELLKHMHPQFRLGHKAAREEAAAEIAMLRVALLDLVEATRNPGDGGEFEDGEFPELDRARRALS